MNEVEIRQMAFWPSPKTIAPGDTVRFVNRDTVTHTVTFDPQYPIILKPDAWVDVRFDKPGDVFYSCSFHPAMKGQIHIQIGE